MAYSYWKCVYSGSTAVAVRGSPTFDGALIDRNVEGTIIKCDDNKRSGEWLYEVAWWNNGSWESVSGYTIRTNNGTTYYTSTSNPGGSSGGSSSAAWNWEIITSNNDIKISGESEWSGSCSYKVPAREVGFGYFLSQKAGTLTITENTQNSDLKAYIAIINKTSLSNSNTFLETISGFLKAGAIPFSYNVLAGTRYEFGIASNKGSAITGTFYVTFTPESSKYTINYYIDSGTSYSTSTHEDGATATLINDKPTKTGYVFKGWAKSSDSKIPLYYSGSNTDITSATNLYAVWWPAFTWKDYTYSEFLTLYNNAMTQYDQPHLAAPLKVAYYEADRVNRLRTILGMLELTNLQGTQISKAPLDECSTTYNKVNSL